MVLYAADAADTVLDRAGTEACAGCCASARRPGCTCSAGGAASSGCSDLLTLGASVDDLGAWVALDVHGPELGPLVPGLLVSWSPRPGRGLFFDRAQHARPEVVIVPSLEAS